MPEVDTLRRFVFERYPFRGQIVRLGPAWRAMMEHHDYPAHVRDPLGEAVAAAALLVATLKFEGLLTLQLRAMGLAEILKTRLCQHSFSVVGPKQTHWFTDRKDA